MRPLAAADVVDPDEAAEITALQLEGDEQDDLDGSDVPELGHDADALPDQQPWCAHRRLVSDDPSSSGVLALTTPTQARPLSSRVHYGDSPSPLCSGIAHLDLHEAAATPQLRDASGLQCSCTAVHSLRELVNSAAASARRGRPHQPRDRAR